MLLRSLWELTLGRRKRNQHSLGPLLTDDGSYTGVSWAVNGGDQIVHLINNWPNPRAQNAAYDKVPSSISYLDGEPDKWGYTVERDDESLKWFKVLLEPNHIYAETVEPVKNSNTLLGEIGKTPQEVAADYLRQIWDYTKEEIRKYQGQDFAVTYALRVILTVPAVWSHAAKENSRQAALAAGMPEDIELVTEPEAAALATLKDRETEAAALARLKDGSKTADSILKVCASFPVMEDIDKSLRSRTGWGCICGVRCGRRYSGRRCLEGFATFSHI